LSQRLGILGGTFNPIHYGHLAAAEEVRDRLNLDRVLFVPSYLSPHKLEEEAPSADRRMEMVRLAISGNPHFESSDLENKRKGTSFTIDTINALRHRYPGAELYFITGLDSFIEIRTWHEWETLLTLCFFVVLSRPGYRFADLMKIDFMKSAETELFALDRGVMKQALVRSDAFSIVLETVPLYDISSTDIRQRVKEGRSIKYHLPEAVELYIMNKRLYA
jgi:nicotinate-nucleotide adenylyltransferase